MPLRELISEKHQQITGIARHQNVIKDIPFRILRGWVFRSQLLTVHIIRARWKQCSASSQSFMNLGDIINHSAMAGALDKGRAIAEVRAIYHFNYVTLSNIFPLIIRHHRRLARLSLHSDTNTELCTRIHLNHSPIIGIHFFFPSRPFSLICSPRTCHISTLLSNPSRNITCLRFLFLRHAFMLSDFLSFGLLFRGEKVSRPGPEDRLHRSRQNLARSA